MAAAVTPKKFYPRKNVSQQGVCRLCGKFTQQRHLIKIFSKIGLAKNLASKVHEVCGIGINEHDCITKVVCRTCESFITKVDEYRNSCHNVQGELNRNMSVKRMLLPEDCNTITSKNEPSRKKLFDLTNVQSADNIDKENIESSDSILKKLNNVFGTKEVPFIGKLMWETPGFKDVFVKLLLSDLNMACKSLCRRDENGSTLLNNTYDGLSNLQIKNIKTEMLKIPYFVDILETIAGDIENRQSEIKYAFIYSILMQSRWHELSLFQRINTTLLIEGGCSKQLQIRFQRLGVCLCPSRREVLLDLIGGHFRDGVIDKVKGGAVFRGTGDMHKNNQNEDLHLFATNLIENRLSFDHLDNDNPKRDIALLPLSTFSLNIAEWREYIRTSKILVGRILLDFFPKFKFLKSFVPQHIDHQYSHEMGERSFIASMPIINANEAHYADCVKILRTYEKWIAEIYHETGMLQNMPNLDDGPLLETFQANPGQKFAHINFTDSDPMKEMKIVFGGDQLTRVRFAGAKDLLAGAHTPSHRFEHCSPFKPVMWHTKAALLQYSYHLLHKPESIAENGTIKYFREKLRRKNVTPAKVLDSFDGCEELFISLGRAYIVVALMKFFGMESLEDKPSVYPFPTNFVHKSDAEKDAYMNNILTKFLDEYLLQKSPPRDGDDFVENYGFCVIFLTILVLQLKDAAKEGDGNRTLINQKMLLNVFKSLGSYSKYALEMFVSIAQVECLLTPRLSEEFKWGNFVNWRGGKGKNIEDDLAQEIVNKVSKNIVQRMGPNKTISSITKITKAANGIKEILENYDKNASIHRSSTQHSTSDAFEDENEMILDLLELKPFHHSSGRFHNSFPAIKRSPLRYMNVTDFHNWLKKHRDELV
ncbi:uncharacterized protein LOC130645814 [Hydractinia symbiolongicarpus]|uniref:uncharacterized protein LOC130645814 n=1 Tax=Hydractinia symbiolongicarpus TaxID=13093 RepID=UPI00254CF196|nr:uncharacterized protein LOC130645814 [Hydractinia symbiolongicarpus]